MITGVLLALTASPYATAVESGAPRPVAEGLETVLVSATPVMGTGIPVSLVPANVQTVRAGAIEQDHADTVTDVLMRHFSSIALADTEGGPFQEDLVARGFVASPVLGTPQGLAVYQNGVRINEAFGDIVLWDFVPVFAVAQLQEMPGSNPVFGLNALGGAVTMEMKDGFDFHQPEAQFSGGSFGRYRATAQDGAVFGDRAVYLGATAYQQTGWRQLSSSKVAQTFADFALRGDDYKLGMSLTLGWSHCNGNGADPVEDNPAAAFAVPDTEIDHLVFAQLRGSKTLNEQLALHAVAYARYANVETQNGAASGFAPCGSTLCDGDGNPLSLPNGRPVPSDLPYGGILPVATTRTTELGGSVQLSFDEQLAGHGNAANLGLSVDQGRSRFGNSTFLGNLVFLNPAGTTTASDGVQLGGDDYNVRLDTLNRYYGIFFTDTFSVSNTFSATLAGRFNRAQVDLSDRFGDSLTGVHSYQRFNPSVGVTYQAAAAVNLYASYSEANRIPTAAELSCANPAQPCTFPLGFISDPGLEQVIARTAELGARGHVAGGDLKLDWFADIFNTRNQNDILFVSSGPLLGSGYFENAGATQRLGAEAALEGIWEHLDFHANYGFVRATFQSHLTMLSDANPGADANGNIFVQPGDRLPEVPMQIAKLGLGYALTHGLHLGVDGVFVSSQYLRGDEANLQRPLPGYALLNARVSWQATPHFGMFLEGENILDHHYSSFGLYGDPTGNGAFPNFSNPRFLTPGVPFGLWAGAQLKF